MASPASLLLASDGGCKSRPSRRNRSRRGKGRWTREEHESFLKGVELHGKDWKAIGDHVRSRTVVQIRTHAQKYFLKADKGIAFPEEPYLSTEDEGVTDSSGSSDSESGGPSSSSSSSAACSGNGTGGGGGGGGGGGVGSNVNNGSIMGTNTTACGTGSGDSGKGTSEVTPRLNSLPVLHPARGKRILPPPGTDMAVPICSFRTTRGRAAAAAKAAAEAEAAKAAAESAASAATDRTTVGGSTVLGSTRDAKRIKLDVNGAFGGIPGRLDDPHGLLIAVDGRRGLGGIHPRETISSVEISTPFAAARERINPVAVTTVNACSGSGGGGSGGGGSSGVNSVNGDIFSPRIMGHQPLQPSQQQPQGTQGQGTQLRPSSGAPAARAASLSRGLIPWASPLCVNSEFGHYSTGVSATTVNVQSVSGVASKTTGTGDMWSAPGSGLDMSSRGALAVAIPSKSEAFASTPTGGSPFNLEFMMDSFQSSENQERFNSPPAAGVNGARPVNAAGAASQSSPLAVTPHAEDIMRVGASCSGVSSDAAAQARSESLEHQSPAGGGGISSQAYFPLKTANAWPVDAVPAVTPQPDEFELDGVTTATAVTAVGSRCMMESSSGTTWCCGDARDAYVNTAADVMQDCVNSVREPFESKMWSSAGEVVAAVNPVAAADSRRSAVTCTAAAATGVAPSVAAPVTTHATASTAPPCLAFGEVLNVGGRSDISRPALQGPVQRVARKSMVRHPDPPHSHPGGGSGDRDCGPDSNISSESPRGGKSDMDEGGHTVERGLAFMGIGCAGGSDDRAPETSAWMEVAETEQSNNSAGAASMTGRAKTGDVVSGSQMATGSFEQCIVSPQPVAGWLGYTGDVSASAGSQQHQLLGEDPSLEPPTCTAAPVAEPLPGVDLEAEDGLLMFLSEDYFGML